MRRALTVGTVTALAFTGLVGCTGVAPSGQAPAARLYPFHSAVYYTVGEQQRIDRALDTAVGDCMRRRGYTYATPTSGSPPNREPDNPYGLLDPTTVGRTGYGIVPATVRDREHPPPADATDRGYVEALDGTERSQVEIALPGGPAITIARDGCEAGSRAAVFGADWDRLYYTVQSLSNMVIEKTQADAAVTAAVAQWSACVRKQGYPAATLDDLRMSIQKGAEAATTDDQTRAVARTELKTAVVDAGCQERVGLRPIVRRAQAQAEQDVLTDAYRRDLHTLRQREQAVLGH